MALIECPLENCVVGEYETSVQEDSAKDQRDLRRENMVMR
jgi:hypothetical protein